MKQEVMSTHLNNTKEIICEVVEGDITDVIVQFQDKMGLTCEGNTDLRIVERELPDQVWILGVLILVGL